MTYPFRTTYRQDAKTYIEDRGYAHMVTDEHEDYALLEAEFGNILAVGQTARRNSSGDDWEVLEGFPLLDAAKAEKLAAIDAETSAAILAGFDYEIDAGNGPESLHFSYDSFDQQNFADTANGCLLAQSGVEGLPTTVTWNGYRNWTQAGGGELVRLTLDIVAFLTLYTAGALVHKGTQMEIGGRRKAVVEAATSIETVVSA